MCNRSLCRDILSPESTVLWRNYNFYTLIEQMFIWSKRSIKKPTGIFVARQNVRSLTWPSTIFETLLNLCFSHRKTYGKVVSLPSFLFLYNSYTIKESSFVVTSRHRLSLFVLSEYLEISSSPLWEFLHNSLEMVVGRKQEAKTFPSLRFTLERFL